MAGYFFTGEEAVTPEAIDRKRALINALAKDNLSSAPVGHWTAALSRVLGSAADNYQTAKLDTTEKKGVDENKAALLAAFGLGGAASPPAPSAGAALPASQPAPATPQSPPQVQQQPLMPNRPQMPPMFENTAGPGAMAPDGTPMPPVRPANPGAPSPFGSVQMPVNPVPSQQAGSTPLWIQQGLTKALPQIGQQQLNPTMAYNEPGPAAPMGGQPGQPPMQVASTSPNATFGRMLQQESGNRQFGPNGQPITSPKGATGIAQVMPGTGPEAARLAGLPWDPNRFRNDAGYNQALGKAYYDAQVKRYGDPVTAAAAYNAGPGNVDNAIKRQTATGQPFTDFLPKETQGYIAAVGGPSGGAPVQMAQAGQPSQTDAGSPAPGAAQAQFNVPGAPVQSGSTPQAAALLQALSSPWAARNPMLAQLGQKVLGEQLTGNKLTYQTLPDGTILALDPTGRRPPTPVYQAQTKPNYGVIGKDEFGNEKYGWINPVTQQVTPGPSQASQQPGQASPAAAIPPAPPGVDPKKWREILSTRAAEDIAPPKSSEVAELRKEVTQLPSYKNLAQAAPIYQSMFKTAGTNSKASDLNLVYGLGKIMDPTSVVREGEMIMVKNTASLPDWLVGAANSLNGGQALTPETRAAILKEAHNRVTSYQDQFNNDSQHYTGIATRNRMKPEDVVPSFGEFKPWGGPQAVAKPTQQPATPSVQPTQQQIQDEMRRRGLTPK